MFWLHDLYYSKSLRRNKCYMWTNFVQIYHIQVYWKTCIESGRSFKISEDNKFKKKMFQKYSLKQAILQLSKAITLIMTVLILQQKLSTRTVPCCLSFQNNVNWLIKSQWIVPSQEFRTIQVKLLKQCLTIAICSWFV